ncbi:MAG: anaerobic sulfatase maturase [Proteobacteria bacterium]|nr:anaerobic sulfatase maturase [Pseudomonadota bacterium]
MFKTVSSNCNLDCSYCYFRESLEGDRVGREIDREMLERFVPEYLDYTADTKGASFGWQGGEPTLAGLDFFRWVVELQARHAWPGTVLSNDLQTNGVLIDDEWAGFFKQYNFLVGVSLDGPEEIHDALRKDRGGRGTFNRVMAGIDALRRRDVELNILCVIGPHNVRAAESMFDFFYREGFTHVQFMSAMNFQAVDPGTPATYLINPEEFGIFMIQSFDAWYRSGRPGVSIRTFDNFLKSYIGTENDLCIHSNRCDSGFVVEHNGDVYPCDFYIHPDFSLGNISSSSLGSMARGEKRAAFIRRKHNLPAECEACKWKVYCKGGCPRNQIPVDRATVAPDIFCRGYKRFFEHAHIRFQSLAEQMNRRATYFKEIDRMKADGLRLPGRNDPCPCNSGRKHKSCCGDPALNQSYLFKRD